MTKIASKSIQIKGHQLHYIEQGEGDPMLFIHGMPTSSYIWRNIIPELSDQARCIAPDLIGMGKSDKPDIDYTVFEHIAYIEAFIEALDLKNITLVVHGWGSVIGFAVANRHPERYKALAFFEAHVRPTIDWNMLSLPVQQLASLLNRPGASYRAIVEQNYLIKKLLPNGTIDPLSEEDYAVYKQPFPSPESRQVLWQYIQDLPLGDGPDEVLALIEDYSQWLQKTPLPKLMMYAIPGFITTVATVQWARDHFPNIQIEALDNVLHFVQESNPGMFSEKLREWYLNRVTTAVS